MGASGAGKTSLLNILACRIENEKNISISGQLLANGNKYDQSNFNDFSAYVMQSDVLMPTLTPRECLMFAANLKFVGK
jgi:ABC-type multidrug transport system ATPase subunit